jgi:hypothetical protein
MPDAQTLGLIGAITGIIGAVTGIAGAVLGYVSYRRSQQIKALDLRLELRRQVADVRAIIAELPNLLKRSKRSREAVLSALGTLRTGSHESWTAAWKNDWRVADGLARELPPGNENYDDATHQELENRLLDVHALGLQAGRLRDKYLQALAEDDREEEHIQANMRARLHGPMDT